MKNKMLLFIAAVVVTAALATVGVASTVGFGYFDGLNIGLNRQAPTMTVSSAGAVVATSVAASGAVSGASVTGATVVSTSYVQLGSMTIANINKTTATVVGQQVFCTTCTDDVVCTSTGTATDHEWVGNNGARATCS